MVTTVSSTGQVVLPAAARQQLRLTQGERLAVELREGGVFLRPIGAAHVWFAREQPIVLGCALTELSFLRASVADKTIAASFRDADEAPARFITALGPRYRFVPAVPPGPLLRGWAGRTHKEVSDSYLCALAQANGAELGTLDVGIKHPAALLIG